MVGLQRHKELTEINNNLEFLFLTLAGGLLADPQKSNFHIVDLRMYGECTVQNGMISVIVLKTAEKSM